MRLTSPPVHPEMGVAVATGSTSPSAILITLMRSSMGDVNFRDDNTLLSRPKETGRPSSYGAEQAARRYSCLGLVIVLVWVLARYVRVEKV